jgi:RNA polymerase sigma-70 factor, ECF subfamily
LPGELRIAFDEHYGDVYRFAYRMVGGRETAEDVAQEAFLRLAGQRNGMLRGESARRWLFVVARNLCLSHLRQAARHQVVAIDPAHPSEDATPAQAEMARERRECVAEAIGALPPHMREALVLRVYEGLSYAEIGSIVGCAEGTVKSRLARAREELKRRLGPLMERDHELESS